MPANRFDDLKNAGVSQPAMVPAVYTSTPTTTGQDMSASEGPLHAILSVGAVTSTTTLTITFTESATLGGTYTAVVGAPTLTPSTAAANFVVVSAPFERSLPFVKAVFTMGGSSISAAAAITLHASKKSI